MTARDRLLRQRVQTIIDERDDARNLVRDLGKRLARLDRCGFCGRPGRDGICDAHADLARRDEP